MRIVGLVVGLILIAIGLIGRRRGRFSRGDMPLWVGFGGIVGLLLAIPRAADVAASLLLLEYRLFAALAVATLVLIVLDLRRPTRLRRLGGRFGDLVCNLVIQDFQHGVESSEHRQSVGIVIAAFNEEQAIRGVFSELPLEVEGYRADPIAVVDGDSDDATQGAMRRTGYSVATHPVNRGQGDALRTGFAIALSRGDEIVVTMDADGQHRPDELPALLKPIVAGEADYVQGSRFLGDYEDAGGSREMGIKLFTRVINGLSDAGITDCTNGFRAIRADSLARLRLEEDRFSAAEIIMESADKGLRMVEVPVHIQSRSHGDSKKPTSLGYPLGYLRTIIGVWLR